MKTQFRTCFVLFAVIGLFIAVLTGCRKDDTGYDLAGIIEGTYTGTVTASGNTVYASTTITKVNETKVDLVVTFATTTVPMNGVRVSYPSDSRFTLAYSDSSGKLTGYVTGNTLNWRLTAGGYIIVFTGTI
jgi:hypothetical protein